MTGSNTRLFATALRTRDVRESEHEVRSVIFAAVLAARPMTATSDDGIKAHK